MASDRSKLSVLFLHPWHRQFYLSNQLPLSIELPSRSSYNRASSTHFWSIHNLQATPERVVSAMFSYRNLFEVPPHESSPGLFAVVKIREILEHSPYGSDSRLSGLVLFGVGRLALSLDPQPLP